MKWCRKIPIIGMDRWHDKYKISTILTYLIMTFTTPLLKKPKDWKKTTPLHYCMESRLY